MKRCSANQRALQYVLWRHINSMSKFMFLHCHLKTIIVFSLIFVGVRWFVVDSRCIWWYHRPATQSVVWELDQGLADGWRKRKRWDFCIRREERCHRDSVRQDGPPARLTFHNFNLDETRWPWIGIQQKQCQGTYFMSFRWRGLVYFSDFFNTTFIYLDKIALISIFHWNTLFEYYSINKLMLVWSNHSICELPRPHWGIYSTLPDRLATWGYVPSCRFGKKRNAGILNSLQR